jgi:hypothetical protein
LTVPTDTITKNERLAHGAPPEVAATEQDTVLREMALTHLEHVRKLKLYAAVYVLAVVVLTPVWVLTQYLDADGWPERFSTESNPGDWDPWILWIVLVGAFLVGIAAIRAHVRPLTEADIEREVERMKSGR